MGAEMNGLISCEESKNRLCMEVVIDISVGCRSQSLF